ncbi:hypothetical protein C5S39_02530 [Candidatus Methanophagaceae archaeon]|nr:hypothetical protein C5S39_02530 [Methanophagales archaeon]
MRRRVSTLSINTANGNDLIRKCTETSWYAVSIHKMAEGTKKRKKANELGYDTTRLLLELLRKGNSDIAIEISMTAIQMFFDGHNYHQVLSCIERLRGLFEGSRLEEDVVDFETLAKNALGKTDTRTKEDRIDVLYSLVWEKGSLGTSDAMKFYKERTQSTISEPTLVSYCKMLKFEQRILSFGGPTGRPIEMFPNNSVSLNREGTYNRVNFFEGVLKAKSNLFDPIWDVPRRKNARVYEVENGNDPRVFALIEPGKSIPPKFKDLGGISKIYTKLGVEGTLHPIKSMPEFGFKLIEDIKDADFLSECKVRPVGI